MPIWFNKNNNIGIIRSFETNTMSEHLGIEWLEMGEDFITARMPVDNRTIQPMGILHGGASCVLAETLGSIASYLVIDTSRFHCAGIEINANHVRMARAGFVIGKATPLHLGSSTHVWDIRIADDKERLICISRLTVAIIKRKAHSEEEKPASSTS
jgi:1,4-dihydroxy-2-naphthoyl-CoA hydrolase